MRINTIPTMNADQASPRLSAIKNPKPIMIRLTDPLTKLGMVFAVVERILVPNCSAAIETNKAQYPVAVPS